MTTARIFLLSPATCSGPRAEMLGSRRARFELALRLQSPGGAPIGEVFAFLSGLYFRGKLAYARVFARPPAALSPLGGALVITPHAGLIPVDAPLTASGLRAAARVDIRADNPRYRRPLEAGARQVAETIGPDCEVVLLGSVASPKYVDVLTAIFGPRLAFPLDFVGRGDMSRGGLMLRSVTAGLELEYVPVQAAVRHGPRPPKLPQLRRAGV
jgi:hypothetical protein